MSQPKSSIISLGNSLEPRHGGLIAWQYSGWADWVERYFADGNHGELTAWAEHQRSLTLGEIREHAGSVTCSVTTVYNPDFSRALEEEQSGRPVNNFRWSAIVASAAVADNQLAALQQEAHTRTVAVGEEMVQRIVDAQAAGEIAAGANALDEVARALPHMHTVEPRLEAAARTNAPVVGLWVPHMLPHQ
jgi:hypothetical protein